MACRRCAKCCKDWKIRLTFYEVKGDGGPNDILWEIPITGTCDYLIEPNICSRYETRPYMCRHFLCKEAEE